MNKKLGLIGSIINAITVLLFAIFMAVDFNFGSYFVCILLSLSFVMMIAAFENECSQDKKVAGKIALVLAGVYSTLIMIVYFTQCTSVIHDDLNLQAAKILNYSYLGLMFNLDLLGYAIMALSTFFIGLTINAQNKKDKVKGNPVDRNYGSVKNLRRTPDWKVKQGNQPEGSFCAERQEPSLFYCSYQHQKQTVYPQKMHVPENAASRGNHNHVN